jgi:hypothetical protein
MGYPTITALVKWIEGLVPFRKDMDGHFLVRPHGTQLVRRSVFSICAAWFLLRLLVDTGSVGLEWLSPDLDDFYVGYTKH